MSSESNGSKTAIKKKNSRIDNLLEKERQPAAPPKKAGKVRKGPPQNTTEWYESNTPPDLGGGTPDDIQLEPVTESAGNSAFVVESEAVASTNASGLTAVGPQRTNFAVGTPDSEDAEAKESAPRSEVQDLYRDLASAPPAKSGIREFNEEVTEIGEEPIVPGAIQEPISEEAPAEPSFFNKMIACCVSRK